MKPNSWVSIPKPKPQASMRLFCFPYAGGSASLFRAWPSLLPDQIELCAIQLPGRENRLREAPFDQLTQLVAALGDALQPYWGKPFAFYGHSMGALISYELARHMRRQHDPAPQRLLVAAHRAPHLFAVEPPLHALPTPHFLAEVRQRYNGIAAEVWEHAELMELVLPQLRADFSLVETYRYQPEAPLACPITAIGGSDDKTVSQEELALWRIHTQADFRLHLLPGDHFFLKQAASVLLPLLCSELESGVFPFSHER